MTFKKNIGYLLALLLLSCSQQSFSAMTCKAHSSDRVTIDAQAPDVPATVKRGTLIWRTSRMQVSFDCGDGEYGDVYFHLDPDNHLSGLDKSIEVILTYNGIDYPAKNGTRVLIGKARGRYLVDAYYSVSVRATGLPPPESGKIRTIGDIVLFRIGGGRNQDSKNQRSFIAVVRRLEGVTFIWCRPRIRVAGTNGSAVNFGSISQRNAVVGQTEKQLPFSISVDMSSSVYGTACADSTMQANFSTSFPVQDGTTIMPTNDSGFGITLSHATRPNNPITINQIIDLGLVNRSFVENRFLAGLKWISNTPNAGPFKVTATVDITFK